MKLTRVLCLMMALILTVAVLAGCGKSTTGSVAMKVEPGTDGKITKEPLELTMHMRIFTDAFNFDKQTMFQEAFKFTNIKQKGTSSQAASDENQEFNIMLASSPLPDIIHGKKANINKAAIDGAMVPLDDLIDQYAPNIKAFLEENPWARKGSVASDGKLYYIPFVREGIPSVGFYIRTDWLKKLNLEVPKTVDEYYNVLKAFRQRDPNGNGKTDEIPYFYRDQNVDGLLQLWAARSGWYIDENGKYIHGKMQPEYKTAMTNLAKWYSEGLIDKEIYTRGKQARETLLGDNVGGSTHDWFSSTGSYNETLKAKVPGMAFEVMAPPADVKGQVKEEMGRVPLPGLGWGISKDNQYVVETIKYFDFWMSQQGKMIFNYGVEGVDYNMVNGKPVYTDKVMKAEGGPPTYLRNIGQNDMGTMATMESQLDAMSVFAKQGFQMYNDKNYCLEQLPSLSFTKEEERVIKEKEMPITTYMKEVQQKWLFGNESAETGYDTYIAQIKSMGYDEVQAAYQSAYDRYLKQ